MTLCECGCGQEVKEGNRFIHGHHRQGIKHTDSAKKKMSELHKGHKYALGCKRTDRHKNAVSIAMKGNQYALGRKHTEEAKKKISIANKHEKNSNWQGGISLDKYCPKFSPKVRESIREEFNRKCFLCGKEENDNGRKLDVHHIDYNREQGCNGHSWKLIPLCMSCHSKISKRNKVYFENLIMDKLKEVRK